MLFFKRQAVHESGHFCAVSQANQTATKFILIFVATIAGRVDLHGNRVSWCVDPLVHFGQVGIDLAMHRI